MAEVDEIIKWESGEMSEEEEIKFFQKLINTGLVWRLQGMYGRRAMELLRKGKVMLGEKGYYDFFGNYIPSRYEVKAGEVGSEEYVKKMKKKLDEMI